MAACFSACGWFASPESRLEEARELAQEGQFVAARSELKSLVEKAPDFAPARVELARVSLRLGDAEAAQKELDRAVQAGADPTDLRALQYEVLLQSNRPEELLARLSDDDVTPAARRFVLTSQANVALGNHDAAQQAIEEALRIDANDPEVLLQHARMLIMRGEPEQAIEVAARLTQPESVHAEALLVGATAEIRKGSYAPARQKLERARTLAGKHLSVPQQFTLETRLAEVCFAQNDLEGADKSIAVLESIAPDSLIAYYMRGRHAFMKSDFSNATAKLEKAVAAAPEHIPAQLLLAASHIQYGAMEQGEAVLQRLLAVHPGNEAARKLLAQAYIATGRASEARKVLAPLSESGANDPQADWLMGAALAQSGQASNALEYLERSLSAAPDDVNRQVDLAATYLAAGESEKALNVLQALPESVATSQRARVILVAASVAGKSPTAARAEIERLVAPENADSMLLSTAGAYLASIGANARAKELLTRAATVDPKSIAARMQLAKLSIAQDDVTGAEDWLKQVLGIDAAYQPAYLTLAEIALRTDRRADAQQWLTRAVGAEPAAIAARLGLARLAFLDQDAKRGRDLLSQAISVGKARPEVLNAVGTVLAQAGLHEEALARFGEASAVGSLEALLNSARVQAEMGQYEQARATVRRALARNPNWAAAQRLSAQLQVAPRAGSQDKRPASGPEFEGDRALQAKQFAAAVAAYERAWNAKPTQRLAVKLFRSRAFAGQSEPQRSLVEWLEHHPQDVDVRRALADYYQAAKNFPAAIEQYRRVLQTRQNDVVALNNLAWLLHTKGDARAVDFAARAYAVAPQMPEIGDTYGWLLVQKGEVQRGLKLVEEALRLAPENRDIAYHVAAARARMGDKAGALRVLQPLLRDSQSFAERAAAEALLHSLEEA